MKQSVLYMDKQPQVNYYVINENKADVIVNKFIKEIHQDTDSIESEYVSYEYETNIFTVNPKEITKEDIESDIDFYLEYEYKEETMEEQVKKLKEENEFLTQCIIEISEVVYNG